MTEAKGMFLPRAEDLAKCVHCGLCLQSCPTFRLLRLEADSPRGRIHIIRAITEGRIEATPVALSHLDLCLQCRNCEAVCPSGVPFGRIMERARATVMAQGRRAPASWRLRAALLRFFVLHPERLALVTLPLRLPGWHGAQARLARTLPRPLRRLLALAPPPAGRPFRRYGLLARPRRPARLRVGLFLGCVMPYLFPGVHGATVRVLSRNGCEVVSPQGQACCGALFAHSGDLPTALELAKRNIDAFLDAGVDVVAINAAGCGALLKEYAELLEHDPAYAERARRFSSLVRDVTELLAELPLEPPQSPYELSVTYQDPCHLAHAQGIKEAPRRLLRSIPGLRLLEMEHPDRCCGSAGIYSLNHPGVSLSLLEERMDEVQATGARVIATANPGCMLQLTAGLRRRGLPGRVAHVVELLDEAYRATGPRRDGPERERPEI